MKAKDRLNQLAQADEATERLATYEEIAALNSPVAPDPYPVPRGYIPGAAAAKDAPLLEDFGRPTLYERIEASLDRLYRLASKFRPAIVAESILALRQGFRRSFERRIAEAVYASLMTDIETHYGNASEEREWAFRAVLVAVIAQDTQGRAEMAELQRLPASRRAASLRLLAFNALVERHWFAAGMVVTRADARVQALMDSFRRAGIQFPENAQKLTYRALVNALSNDAALCSQLTAPHEGSSPEIYGHINKHLGRIVKSGLRGDRGQPLAADEHATVSAQLFNEVQHNG